MRLRLRALHLAVLMSLLAAFAGGPARVSATPPAAPNVAFVVNNLGDAADANLANPACDIGGGQCTLRAALQQANATAGPDSITFSVTGAITFTTPSPTITDTLTIVGPGAALLTLNGNHVASVLLYSGSGPGTFWVEGLTLTGGSASEGGGLRVSGASVTVISATVLTANSAGFGGGASVLGRTQLINSAVLTNTASLRGGGLRSGGPLEIINSRIAGNAVMPLVAATVAEPQGVLLSAAGGGLYADGPLTMTDSLVQSNYVVGPVVCPLAGGICPLGSGPYGAGLTVVQTHAEIRGSTLSGNYFTGSVSGQAAPAGSVQGSGGAVYVYGGVLIMSDSQVVNNSAYYGGGLFNEGGDVALRRVTVFDNTAGSAGGGAFSENGPLLVEDSKFVDNRTITGPGGGLYFINGALVVRGSEFDGNGAGLTGGGLTVFDAGALIETTEVHGNVSGYAPFAAGQALVPQAGAADGGGLLLGASIVVIRQAAIYSNTATGGGGGGLSNSGTLTMTNVTVSGNSATDSGGGLALTPVPASAAGIAGIGPAIRAYLRHVTIANNTADSDNNGGNGGGVSAAAGMTVTFTSSLVALNVDVSGPAPACGGAGGFVSAGYNLWTVTTNCGLAPTTGDQFNVPAGIQPLANNGGGTHTHGLNFGSLALDAADPGNCPAEDQRGAARPFGATCDVGAFEMAPLFLPLVVR